MISSNAERVFVRTLLICIIMLAAFSSNTYAQENLRIFLDSTAQVIRGFGAANIVGWRPDMTDDEIDTAFGVGDGKLGFSILRLRIPPQESQWSANVTTAEKAHAMGAKIIASPWSPPANMKTNNNIVGGELREDMYDDYAEHLASFNSYMADNGVPVYAISVQNEPDIQVSYESCDWSPGDMGRFVRENAPTIGTRVMAPESFQFRRQMSDPMLLHPQSAENLDIVAGHIYGGGLSPYPLAQEEEKELWMTEHLVLETDLEANIGTAVEIQNVMRAGMNAYVWWYIVRFYGPISDGESGDYAKGEITKRGYVMSQFSRFIRPGYVRVHTDLSRISSGISATAYKDSSRVVLVAVNNAQTPGEVTFTLEGGVIERLSPYVTSESQNVERLDDVDVSGSSFTVTLGANSVTTFVSDYSAVSNVDVAAPPHSYRLSQNYPNPFRSVTAIDYAVPGTSDLTLKVFDLLGRNVATLVDARVSAGSHQVTFDASQWPAGVYVYQLRTDDVVHTRRMALIR